METNPLIVHRLPLNHLTDVDIAEFDHEQGHDYVEQHGIPLAAEGFDAMMQGLGYCVNTENHVLVAIPFHLFPNINRS